MSGNSLRLALVHPRVDPSRGGAETYVADLARGLIAAGHRVDVVTADAAPGALPDDAGLIRVALGRAGRLGRVVEFAVESEATLRSIGRNFDCTVGFINTWHQDVIIPQGGLHAGSLERNARRYAAGPARWCYASGKRLNPKDWVYRWIERRQYEPARGTRVVAVSHLVRGHLERYRGVGGDRVRVIPNAIDADRLAVGDRAATRAAFRARLGIGERDLLGLFVGHNPRLKGLPALLDTLGAYQAARPGARPIHLAVCAGGDLGDYRRRAERLGLGGRVHLLGFEEDVRPCFHGADFLAHPTYYDPCSLVVFEALACGLPVVTTLSNGAAEVMTNGVQGFVVGRPDAREEWLDALALLGDDARRAAMSEAARTLGREQSFDRHVGRLVELFREVAARKRQLHAGSRSARGPHATAAARTVVR